jgi:hypothetical protein
VVVTAAELVVATPRLSWSRPVVIAGAAVAVAAAAGCSGAV